MHAFFCGNVERNLHHHVNINASSITVVKQAIQHLHMYKSQQFYIGLKKTGNSILIRISKVSAGIYIQDIPVTILILTTSNCITDKFYLNFQDLS
jgi:hypothetical protein